MRRVLTIGTIWIAGALGWAASDPRPAALTTWKHDISPPLRDLAARVTGTLTKGSQPPSPSATGPVPGVSFPGISAAEDPGAALPPDANGAAGPTQFVQWVNTVIAVFNKSNGGVLLGPAPGNSIWSGFGGPCETHNSGQPIAQFDKNAGRWVLAQPVLTAPYGYCIAVSLNADATGRYHRFAFGLTLPAGTKPDSPKLAVWPDAYYTSFNLLSGGTVAGALAVAFDRINMLNGTTRAPVAFTLASTRAYMLPSDWDGASAPSRGEPDFYMRVGSPTTLQLFKFHVDFNSPGNSTFSTQPVNITIAPPPQEIHPDLCTHRPGHCQAVRQPAPGVNLDALPNALMYRLIWRRLLNREHLLMNQTVFGSQAVASVNWYDVVSPNGVPQLLQQGSVGDPAASYWIGSAAMDKLGDIALGFNVSGTSLFPSIGITGRLAGDPPGTTAPPQIVVPGTNVQTVSGAWGAYASMSVDPADDCTLWYTAEVIQSPPNGATPNWNTWIVSMRFPACQ